VAARTRHEPSQLFTIRVWQEQLGEGRFEWRGRVQHVLTGRAFYFRSWLEMTQRLCALLETTPSTTEPKQTADG
jgi:hypothetical protein